MQSKAKSSCSSVLSHFSALSVDFIHWLCGIQASFSENFITEVVKYWINHNSTYQPHGKSGP